MAEQRAAFLVVLVFAGLFLSINLTHIRSPFGDSHDGRNGAVWASGSRSLRRYGPMESRLGARRETSPGTFAVYIDHPPLIYVETAAAELVGGQHPWASRAPAWLGSTVAIFLLWILLDEVGIGSVASAVGVVLGLGCPMFAVFGTMLDSWIIGLPWALATLLLWERGRQGRPVRPALLAIVTVGTVGSCWLGWLIVGLVCGSDLAVARRGSRLTIEARTRLVVAAGTGLAVGAWIVWASGSLDGLRSVFLSRSGNNGATPSLTTLAKAAWGYTRDLWAPWQLVLGGPALVVGLTRRATRPLVAVGLAAVSAWCLLFRDGFAIHGYWTYWLTVPLAAGFAAGFDVLFGMLVDARRAIAAASCAAVGLLGLVIPSFARFRLDLGITAGDVLSHATYPSDQRTSWYFGSLPGPVDWIAYATERPPANLATAEDVVTLAAASPHSLVLVAGPYLTGLDAHADPSAACGETRGRSYTVATAAAVAQRLNARC